MTSSEQPSMVYSGQRLYVCKSTAIRVIWKYVSIHMYNRDIYIYIYIPYYYINIPH